MLDETRDKDVAGPLPTLGSTQRALSERVAGELRDRIIKGDLAPGTHLVERTLAESLGVSRVPVRDALNLLKGEGFFPQQPRRGVVVTRLSSRDVEELFEVRLALEVLAVRLASERATDEDLRRLEDSLAESTAAIEAHDSERLHRANEDFHDAIIASAHNHLLASLHEPLMGRLHWLLRQNEEPLPLHAEHEHLYDAIMSRDPEKASVASQAHIRSSRLMARRTLGNAGDDSEPAASEVLG